MAALWGSSVRDAKLALAEKVSTGRRAYAERLVAEASGRQRGDAEPSEDAAVDRYVESNYEYCDALMLGRLWQRSAYDAKVLIGRKLAANNRSGIEYALEQAREHEYFCSFADTGLNYGDAEILARAWGMSINETKARLADKVSMGQRDMTMELIEWARNPRG